MDRTDRTPEGTEDIPVKATDEFARQERVAYQMVSMHCEMRDLYARRHDALLTGIMVLSVGAGGFAFAQTDVDVLVAGASLRVSIVLGIVSISVLFLTVFDLMTNWAGRSKEHAVAAVSLANLRSRQRELKDCEHPTLAQFQDLTRAYNQVVDTIVAIPQRHYERLYGKHHRMVSVTAYIRKHPGVPRWLAHLRILRSSIKSSS
ncbi:hypothetical protein [Microbacterium sp. RURRCA19A]|uniref:hypothetical protein n=1 Tax=Microbacterium sp. RURRCA19A TaxID=1907391 RepID=UPI001115660B|nr:hypothetical protein [Microbacterium sp. RURRCA19A]